MLEELFDALDEHCPPYCYFGAHEGDGSDYGCWVDLCSLNDSIGYETSKFKAGDPWPFDLLSENVIEVNDHGNATLYVWDAIRCRYVEAWSVV
jgi:hypothetical protein